jgi:hypothetical protein
MAVFLPKITTENTDGMTNSSVACFPPSTASISATNNPIMRDPIVLSDVDSHAATTSKDTDVHLNNAFMINIPKTDVRMIDAPMNVTMTDAPMINVPKTDVPMIDVSKTDVLINDAFMTNLHISNVPLTADHQRFQ